MNRPIAELEPSLYGLSEVSGGRLTLPDFLAHFQRAYCGRIGAEFMHLETAEEREWFAAQVEGLPQQQFSNEEKLRFARLLLLSQNWDHFLARKFGSVKRYGGEGAESAMAAYAQLFLDCSKYGIEDVVMCMAHRGRLNLLTLLLNFPPIAMFHKMRGKPEFPADVEGMGDVLSHLVSSTTVELESGKSVRATLLPNPSHLEAVNPAAAGKARGRMESRRCGDYGQGRSGDSVLCLQVHGDAALAGQGIVAETLQISQLPHFSVGGSVHLVLNNQLGYTTPADRARSSRHAADLAKSIAAPVLHVNGDCPEETAKAMSLALAYRERFRKDVFVNLLCYRRWGHNELDDPSFTQPQMYDVIAAKASVPDQYAAKLTEEGILSPETSSGWLQEHSAKLQADMDAVDGYQPVANHLSSGWSGLKQAPLAVEVWDTGLSTDLIRYIASASVAVPTTMTPHPHLAKTHCAGRAKKAAAGDSLDWATAEAAAFGSLLMQGYGVRICGQDVGRGTFSHRHAMLVDRETDAVHIPLNHLSDQQAFLEVVNSPLSEEAVLGFEWGLSIESPQRLCVWEAQFGDFFNGAQIIIDTFIASGETKWLTQTGMVMLLPHGMDGAGPEHSSCRIERFLQLTDSSETSGDGENVNMCVANPSTSAQYFHLLRRQMLRPYRKPLIIASPKVLLRLPAAASPLAHFAPGTHFHPVLPDTHAHGQKEKVKKVVLCSGRHFYTLREEREKRGLTESVALVRVEALCPFPLSELRTQLQAYPATEEVVWSQEEARNAGAWTFLRPRFESLLGLRVRYAGRPIMPCSATAIAQHHQEQSRDLLDDTFR